MSEPIARTDSSDVAAKHPGRTRVACCLAVPVLASSLLGVLASYLLLNIPAWNDPDSAPLAAFCHERISAEFGNLPRVVDRVHNALRDGQIDLKADPAQKLLDDESRDQARGHVFTFLLEQLSHPSVSFVSIGTPDGHYFSADRVTEAGQVTVLFCDPAPPDKGGTAGKLRIYPQPGRGNWKSTLPYIHQYPDQYNPAKRPWYQLADRVGRWIEPYLYVTNRDTGLNYSRVVYSQDERALGVVTASTTVRQLGHVLADELEKRDHSETSIAFLVREQKENPLGVEIPSAFLLATSDVQQFAPELVPAQWPRRFTKDIWDRVRFSPSDSVPVGLFHHGERFMARVRELTLDWPNDRVYLVTCTRLPYPLTNAWIWLGLGGLVGVFGGVLLLLRPWSRLCQLEQLIPTLNAELRKKESLLQLIHATATESLFVKDRQGRYIHANDKCAHDVGRASATDLINHRDQEFFDEHSWMVIRRIDEDVLDGRPVRKEVTLRTGKGRTFRYLISKNPWIVDGKCLGLVGWASDVSAKQEAVEHLTLVLDLVAHDLRTHFLPLSLYCDYLPASQIAAARGCIADLDAMAQDLKTAAELARLERGDRPDTERQVDVVAVLCNLCQELDTLQCQQQFKASEYGVRLAFDVDPSCAEPFVTDPARLRHAIGNVIGNALKFSFERHIVSVRCHVGQETNEGFRASAVGGFKRKLLCEVRDTGPGLAPGQERLIFEKFHRTQVPDDPNATSPRPKTGLGLGLFISKSIVEDLLKGSITAENRKDVRTGARFLIEVPEASASGEVRIASASRVNAGEGPVRILLVDDEPRFVRELASRLRAQSRHRFVVDVRHRSTEVLDLWEQKRQHLDPPYHVLVLDYELADMNGPATARLLRKNYGLTDSTFVVCMTASLSQDRRRNTTLAGMDLALEKDSLLVRRLLSVIDGGASVAVPEASVPVPLPEVDGHFADDLVRRFPRICEDLPEFKEKVALMRLQYQEKEWHKMANTAHGLGGVVFRYDLNGFTSGIERCLAPNDETPKNPAGAEHSLVQLESIVKQLTERHCK